MELILEREGTNDDTGAVFGKLYVDGDFFGYTLENSSTLILPGEYQLGTRFSPKLLSNKIEIIVPGRNYLMFHGGNTPDQSAGCVLLAANRIDDSTIQGDLSSKLYTLARDEANAGNAKLTIKQKATGNGVSWLLVAAFAAGALYYITK